MQAVVLHHLGDIPRFESFPDPDTTHCERLVGVSAAAIHAIDRQAAAGRHASSPLALPVVCGVDGVGHTAGGERVYFSATRRPFGAMAEFAPADWVVPLPDGLPGEFAAALVRPALMAWLPLAHRAELEPGETVMVLGATTAAGRMAVQAARLLGAKRIIAAGHRQEALATLEADATIDLRMPRASLEHTLAAYVEEGIDVILDYIWGEPVEVLAAALVRSDHVVPSPDDRGVRLDSVAERPGGDIVLPAQALRDSRLRLMGYGPSSYPPLDYVKAYVEDILMYALDGDLRLDVETKPMAEVAEAWERAGRQDRRIVLTLDEREA